jgi:hypothetical protein
VDDLEWERKSDTDEGVEGEGVNGGSCGPGAAVLNGLSPLTGSGDEVRAPKLDPTVSAPGVGLREMMLMLSSRSARETRIQRCLQISSESLGPGSPSLSKSIEPWAGAEETR